MDYGKLEMRVHVRRETRALLVNALNMAMAWAEHPRTTTKQEALDKLEQAWGAFQLARRVGAVDADADNVESWCGIEDAVFYIAHTTISYCPNTKEGRKQAWEKIDALCAKAHRQASEAWNEEHALLHSAVEYYTVSREFDVSAEAIRDSIDGSNDEDDLSAWEMHPQDVIDAVERFEEEIPYSSSNTRLVVRDDKGRKVQA